jgi:hypothetical protein
MFSARSDACRSGEIVPMNVTLHRLLAVAGVALILGGLMTARLSAIGFDFWNAPKLQAELQSEQALDKSLDEQSQAIARRTAEKDAIVEEIAAGRLDMVHAADLFCRLHEGQANFMAVLREHYPHMTDEERICRNLIDFAATRVDDRPEGPGVIAQLEREFRQFQRSRVHSGV